MIIPFCNSCCEPGNPSHLLINFEITEVLSPVPLILSLHINCLSVAAILTVKTGFPRIFSAKPVSQKRTELREYPAAQFLLNHIVYPVVRNLVYINHTGRLRKKRIISNGIGRHRYRTTIDGLSYRTVSLVLGTAIPVGSVIAGSVIAGVTLHRVTIL